MDKLRELAKKNNLTFRSTGTKHGSTLWAFFKDGEMVWIKQSLAMWKQDLVNDIIEEDLLNALS